MNVTEKLMSFIRDEEGLTAVEYAIAGGLVGATVIAGFIALGGKVGGVIDYLQAQINAPS